LPQGTEPHHDSSQAGIDLIVTEEDSTFSRSLAALRQAMEAASTAGNLECIVMQP
jgi:hypothetical protein